MASFGLPSETFIPAAIDELERLGWEPWIAARWRESPGWPAFPAERLLTPSRPAPLIDRVLKRMAPGAERDFVIASRGFTRSLRTIRPDLIHAQFGWSAAYSQRAAEKLQIPLIATFHGTDLTVDAASPSWRHRYQRLFERLDHAIVVSSFLERRLRALGYTGRLDVIPAGVQLPRVAFRGARQPDGHLRMVFVGRLVDVKGLDVLLDAMPKVVGEAPARLTVLGDGPRREKLAAQVTRLGLEGDVVLRGAQPHDEVVRAIGEADVVVVPSRTMPNGQAEGSPVVAKEALAIGAQLVATDVGGLPEVLPPSLRGDAVAGESPAALSEAVLKLWRDQSAWPERAALGRAWAEQSFDWEHLARRISAIYESYVGARPSMSTGTTSRANRVRSSLAE